MMEDWNKKIPLMAEIVAQENIALFGGVPSWLLVLFREVLRQTGKNNLLEILIDQCLNLSRVHILHKSYYAQYQPHSDEISF